MAQAHVVLKLADEETADAVPRTPNLRDLDSVSKMLGQRFSGSPIRPLFTSLEPKCIQDLMARAAAKRKSNRRPANLLNYHRITCGSELEAEELAKSLSTLPNVQTAYVERRVTDAGLVNALDDVYAKPRPDSQLNQFPAQSIPYEYQGYLDRAPFGIDARYAWMIAGGDGDGTSLVAVQTGWLPDHQDLIGKNVTALSGLNRYDITHDLKEALNEANHGTAMLGIVCGADNDVGMVGIAPNVSPVQICSTQRSPVFHAQTAGDNEHTPGNEPYAAAIAIAAAHMSPGGVLLLPLQVDGRKESVGGKFYVQQVPIEIEPATFAAIEHATSVGIVVIEAAGNGVRVEEEDGDPINADPHDPHIGGVNLDEFKDVNGKYALNRDNQDHFKDSGAIIVGAALAQAVPITPQQPLPLGHNRADARYNVRFGPSGTGSNYGSRVDCHAWGQRVLTAAAAMGTIPKDETDPTKLYRNIPATSASSAIIAGAALCLQGVHQKWKGRPLTPDEIRTALSSPDTGTPQGTDVPGHIGVMPDLKKVILGFGPNPPPAV